MAIEDDRGVRTLLRGVLEAPAAGVDDLPELLAALEHEDPQLRIGAAWAICAVATARPDSAGDIRRQLTHRSSTAAALAGEWIERECDLGPDAVDAAAASDPAGAGTADAEAATATGTESADRVHDDTTGTPAAPAGDSGDTAGGPEDPAGTSSDRSRPPGTDEVVKRGQFTIELDRTAVDGLDVVDRVSVDRYAWTYAGMATIDARERAVLVRTYRPPEGARLSLFADALEDAFEAWSDVDDHEGVLPVHDHGRRPHPWIVLGYAHDTVRTTGRLPVELALRVGEQAADALAHAHERGVIHRSLDPRSLAVDARDGSPAGRLLNVGVVDAFRAVDGPLPLDSRFAAPEQFDAAYGSVDARTDVYQLGTVLYTALTGRPPYGESLVDRGGPEGLAMEPPSAVVSRVPESVDGVVETATAVERAERYASADAMARAIARLREELEDSP